MSHSDQQVLCPQEMKELFRNQSEDINLQPNDRDILAWKAFIKVCITS